jgi:hypothetical protein
MAGVTAENVRTYRHRRGIPASWQGEDQAPEATRVAVRPDSAPATAPVAPPPRTAAASPARAPAKGTLRGSAAAAHVADVLPVTDTATPTAYVVTVDTGEGPCTYALIAPDIATAAREAASRLSSRHPDGTIRAIQRVAAVLPN